MGLTISQYLLRRIAQFEGKPAIAEVLDAHWARSATRKHARPGAAAGVVYAVGRVNFLSDSSQKVHMRTDQLARLLGVKQATMANKGRLIMDSLRIGHFDAEFSRREMIEQSPFTWLLEVNGMIMDARNLTEELQVVAYQRGLIPYVPAQAGEQ